MTLATTVSLAALRGPVPLAKAVAALDILSGGRVVAGVGAGSSRGDYDAVGADFEDRWQRFDEAVVLLRALLGGAGGGGQAGWRLPARAGHDVGGAAVRIRQRGMWPGAFLAAWRGAAPG